ncbi:MAG: universal stress protein, partial [Nitrososphaeraceae archaeon]
KKLNVQTEVLMDVGSVPKAIVEYAEKNNANLIVLGTRGISGIKRMLVGSTASEVVKYSHCPVMVVK